MFARVIAFHTVIGPGQVPWMAAFLADAFRRAGWPAADVTVIFYGTSNADGTGLDKTAAAPACP